MPINNHPIMHTCTVCDRRMCRPTVDSLCSRCRWNRKQNATKKERNARRRAPPPPCSKCGEKVGKGNLTGVCRACWNARGETIASRQAERNFQATLKRRPPGWLEHLDKMAALAAAEQPLFGA